MDILSLSRTRNAHALYPGVLEPTLRNYILSHSSGVFHHSYQPRKFGGDLSLIAFGKFGGSGSDSGDAKLFESLSNSSLGRDERAPVNPTAEDLAGFECRKDVQALRQEMRDAVDPAVQNRVSHRIANIIQSLSRLRVQELRKAYFAAADQRRGQGLPTDDLAETPAAIQSPATRIGQFLRCEELSHQGNTRHSPVIGKLLLDFLQNRLSPLSGQATITSSESETLPATTSSEATIEVKQSSSEPKAVATCLLCRESCANRSSLTRHHKRKHLPTAFQRPFPCPECQRLQMGDHMIDGAPAWSNHAETYHGQNNAPRLPKVHQVWHMNATSGPSQVWCLICSKHFVAGKGFMKHLGTHKAAGIFAQPFQCTECPENTWIDGLSEWINHSAGCHGGCPQSGAGLKRTCEDGLTDDRSTKKCKLESGQGYGALSASQLADTIPIDPALLES